MTEIGIPYIPDTITVHLDAPNVPAENVTVPFLDYLKNVASSEIYPTWDEAALRANILAQASFALNKIYLEYYPSRGYDFDITSSTAYDQKYIHGRDIFDNVAAIVDDLFGTYIRRQGTIEPLASSFCNGTTVTCSGMSQWGSQSLAEQGYSSIDILRYYYGDDIELVTNAPVQSPRPSYPGTPLQLGSSGESVLQLQYSLNRIAQNYPAIPKITPVDGLFGPGTDSAVRKFQEIFSLTPDGIVGKATWYQIVAIYVAVTRLAELNSEGQRYLLGEFNPPNVLSLGSSGEYVTKLQYMLEVLSQFIPEIPSVSIDGQYGVKTRDAVLAFQRFAGLTPSGITGNATWAAIYNRFAGISDTVLENTASPAAETTVSTISEVQRSLQNIAPVFASLSPPRVTGMMDRSTSLAIAKLQTQLGLRPTGQINQDILKYLTILSSGQLESTKVRYRQYPGFALSTGQRDSILGKEAQP